jgi:ABC-2 type transport system ATP-binding protein
MQMKKISLYFMMCTTILALLLAACSSLSPTSPTPTPLPAGLSGAISGKVDVGGYELYYKCTGQGSPTVILEAGGPSDSTYWDLVMLYFGEASRICAYDRANLGNSDPAPKPRTFDDMTRDLHALLVNAPLEGPYVLVGHSMGGMLVRLFADQYPEEVAGLVLVDSAHPDMGDRLQAALPPESAGEPESFKAWRQYSSFLSASNGREMDNPEGVDAKTSNEQVRAVNSLGDLPLVVISRSPNNPVLAVHMPSLPEETNAKLLQTWQVLQAELMGLSSNSTRIIADHAGHNINLEEPRLVVDAIQKLVQEYRVKSGDVISPTLLTKRTDATNHPPVILGVTERQETRNGFLFINKDITFTDPGGDAITVVNTVISSTQLATVSDDIIRASADDQKGEALVTSSFGCGSPSQIVMEYRIFDRAGNLSEPVTVTFSCPAPQKSISPYLLLGFIGGPGLLVGVAWLLVRYRRPRLISTKQKRTKVELEMNAPDEASTENWVIETYGLTKTYKGVQALKALDLKVREHSICGFLGPNGAGKTTTIKLLLGLARPTGGSGRVFGLDIETRNDEIRRRVGYLAQDPRFYEYMTARETLRFTARFFYEGPQAEIEARIAEVLELVGLSDKADRPVKGFSGGERQRLGIAQAQVNYPDLLILDEPAAALDPIGRKDVLEVMEKLREHTTIFYSTHILDDVQRVSDTVIILNRGALVAQGPIEELLAWGHGNVFNLTVKGDSAAVEARLRRQPWVSGIEMISRNGRVSWQIRVSDPDLAEAQLAPLALAGGNVTLCEFGRKAQNLEDVFMDIVKESNHDR